MLISVHPRAYSLARARAEKGYARHFAKGWQSLETQSVRDFCAVFTSQVWSPIIFAEGHRLSANFVKARLLVLDFDSPGYTLEQALRDWCDTIHFIGLSKSHQRDKGGIVCDRFRLVVPYEREITCGDEYHHNYQLMAKRYDSDQQTKDKARLFYPCTEVVSVCVDGFYQPVDKVPERYKSQSKTLISTGVIPNWTRHYLVHNVIPEGQRNTYCFRIAKDLLRMGFVPEEVLDKILASPTYSTRTSPLLTREIQNAIKSALSSLAAEEAE